MVDTLEALLEGKDQKVVFLMVPAGPITESVITQVKPFLQLGDIIIDAGNSNFNDSLRRYQTLKADGIDFVDCGTSGGTLWRKTRCLFDGRW